MTGYAKLHSKIFDNPLFRENPAARHLFMDLLAMNPWGEREMDWRGRKVVVKRGEVMISERALAKLCGFSYQSVRTIMRHMLNHGILKCNALPNRGPLVITICNFDKYHADQRTPNAQPNAPLTHTQRTTEEGEEAKNSLFVVEADEPDLFDAFWQAYPRKTNKKEARKAWDRAIKRGAKPETIMAGVKQRVGGLSNRPDYIPHASTWLNNDRWENAPDLPNGHSHSELDFLLKPRPDTRHLEIVGDYN